MPLTVKDSGGVLRQVTAFTVKDSGGVLRTVQTGHVKDSGGVLRLFYSSAPSGSITAILSVDANDLNLAAVAIANGWDGVSRVDFLLFISPGVYLRASTTGAAALVTGVFPATSTVVLVNEGYIQGRGGSGGSGGFGPVTAPTVGEPGGTAITLQYPLTINNTNGYILGGGGGGGGGDFAYRSCGIGKSFQQCYGTGGGGGGGAGSGAGGISSGNPGGPGSNTVVAGAGGGAGGGTDLSCCGGGVSGSAGAGGDWGAGGSAGGVGFGGGSGSGAPGGSGGSAILRLGQGLTITGGNNPTQIKGSVI